MKAINMILAGLILASVVCGQAAQKKVTAQSVIADAKEAIAKDIDLEKISGLRIKYRVSRNYKDAAKVWNLEETDDLRVSGTDKIRLDTDLDHGDQKTRSNRTSIANGSDFDRTMEMFSEGKKVNATFSFATPKEKEIQRLKGTAWQIVFPMTLNTSIYEKLDLTYLGVADSKEGTANVVRAVVGDKTYQMFFDAKSHLLLMMIESLSVSKESKPVLTKWFFSDYRNEKGLLTAHKIVMQSESETVGSSSTNIQSVEINPEFKAEVFSVK